MTLVEVLRGHAVRRPERVAYRFLSAAGDEAAVLTYGELWRRSTALAARLLERARPGDRAMLLYPHGPEFVVAFWGCLSAGLLAAPALPPEPTRLERALGRLGRMLASSRPVLVLTTSELEDVARRLVPAALLGDAALVATEALDGGEARDLPPPRADAPAFVQYTSGSTTAPRGVLVTHANLVANERMIETAFGHGPDTRVVSWLPVYHDMGLVGSLLQPAWLGVECTLLSPATFLAEPASWLRAISRYRATTSGGPSFAYDLCVRRVSPADLEGLDLASWRVAFNGAEPVRADTLERFATTFASAGFDRAALYPCYGLAEATVLVSGPAAGAGPRVWRMPRVALGGAADPGTPGDGPVARVVSCGRPAPGLELLIVDPDTRERRPGGVLGEIWVRGPSVASGYLDDPAATSEVFGAAIAGEASSPGWLRTGDLGLVKDGELVVAGRLKDLIIVRGVNFYPQDLEHLAALGHRGFAPGAAVAFAAPGADRERVVLVQGVRRDHAVVVAPDHPALRAPGHVNPPERGRTTIDALGACEAVRQTLQAELELAVDVIILVPADAVPRTSSGKVQRALTRRSWLAGELSVICEWRNTAADVTARPPAVMPARPKGRDPTATEIETVLLGWLAARLATPLELLRPEDPLASYGLDSAGLLELLGALEDWLGRTLSDRTLFAHPTPTALARHLAEVYPQLPPRAPPAQAAARRVITPDEVQRLLHGDDTPAATPTSSGDRAAK